MALSTPNQYPVFLTDEQRQRFHDLCRNGRSSAKAIRHAQVLLLSDHNRSEGRLTRKKIADMLGMHINTVDRVCKRFVQEGEVPALQRKVRETPPTPAKIDGRAEAHLVALCCSKAPEGRTRWTLKLLADELQRQRVVTEVSAETVRRVLKKTNYSLGENNAGAYPSVMRRGSWLKWRKFSTFMPLNTRKKSP